MRLTKHNSHKHKCGNCGFVWRHADSMGGNGDAHTCVCGRKQWEKYRGDDRAEYVGNGRPTRVRVVKERVAKATAAAATKTKVVVSRAAGQTCDVAARFCRFLGDMLGVKPQ